MTERAFDRQEADEQRSEDEQGSAKERAAQALASVAEKMLDNTNSLDDEARDVLYDNLPDLYDTGDKQGSADEVLAAFYRLVWDDNYVDQIDRAADIDRVEDALQRPRVPEEVRTFPKQIRAGVYDTRTEIANELERIIRASEGSDDE